MAEISDNLDPLRHQVLSRLDRFETRLTSLDTRISRLENARNPPNPTTQPTRTGQLSPPTPTYPDPPEPELPEWAIPTPPPRNARQTPPTRNPLHEPTYRPPPQHRNPLLRPVHIEHIPATPSPQLPANPSPLRIPAGNPPEPHAQNPAHNPRINSAIFTAQAQMQLDPRNTTTPNFDPYPLGPLAHSVEPLTTLLPEFRHVIDYRSYRLTNQSPIDNQPEVMKGSASRTVSRMRSMVPRLQNFDGRNPIALLRFLRDIRHALNGVTLSEGAAVVTISWFLEGDALHTYATRTFSSLRHNDYTYSQQNDKPTWPAVVNTLLERYLPDEVLRESHTKITTATQNPDENEDDFMTRLERYSDECCGVFESYVLVNYFLSGLHPTIRPTVTQRVHELPASQRTNPNTIRRIAKAEGNAYRSRRAEYQSMLGNATTSKPPRPASPASSTATLLVQSPPTSFSNPPPPSITSPILAIADHAPNTPSSISTIDATADTTIKNRISELLPVSIPTLTPEQTAMAL